jgi:hypothetical protein
MKYRLLRTNENGVKIYARIDDDNLCRVTCNEFDEAYLAWVAEGNTPEPAENT